MKSVLISKSIWTLEGFSSLSNYAKLIGIGLLSYSDENNNFSLDLGLIRSNIVPSEVDLNNISACIEELKDCGYISGGPIIFNISIVQKRKVVVKGKVSVLEDKEFISAIKLNPAYLHLDIDRELQRCDAWCLSKGFIPSRSRFVNWINRIPAPLKLNNSKYGNAF